jgi:hypothetical protein
MKTQAVHALLFGFVAIAFMIVRPVQADTTLLFEFGTGQAFGNIPSDYGSRVTGNFQNGYHYGGAANTPNIVASIANAAGWPTEYGDLTNVCYPFPSTAVMSITLTADPGYRVALQSFDLAGWPFTDYTIKSVQVRDGIGTLLYSAPNLLVQGDSIGPQHTSLNFAPLVAPTLQISIDATNITAAFGASNVGLDNVRFSQQAVPEPAAFKIAGTGALFAGVFALTQRRSKNRNYTRTP